MRAIEENNKLIAEFLGYTQPHPDYPCATYWYKKDESPLTLLSFDSDCNWLMEVVEKIESFVDKNKCAKYNFTIEQSFVEIIDNNTSDIVVEIDRDTKIEAVYNACVEFIKWYNGQKQY
jgi:hypothetical protein